MRILGLFSEFSYGDPERGPSYEATHFLPALRALGHEVDLFDTLERSPGSDFAELNRRLFDTVRRTKPDLVFAVPFHYEIWLETFESIRDLGSATLALMSDDSWRYESCSRYLAPAFDAIATTYPEARDKYARDGFDNVVLTQWAIPRALLREPLPASQCRYPVSFVGAAYGHRRPAIDELRRSGIAVQCFGQGWPNGPIATDEALRLVRESVFSLNFAAPGVRLVRGARVNQIKGRVFEVPGTGGCLMTEPADHLDDFFKTDREILTFNTTQELAEKVTYYLKHPAERDEIARSGFKRTERDHTYEDRFSELISFTLARRSAITSPAGHQTAPQTMQAATKMHRTGVGGRILRWVLVRTAALIWGRERGARAARRLIFEASWRLRGRTTYTARGLPGRLFYDVS